MKKLKNILLKLALSSLLCISLSSMSLQANNVGHTLKPVITAISPNSGHETGGTQVVIIGTNFFNTVSVFFGKVPAASFVVHSEDTITAISPVGYGDVDIVVVMINEEGETIESEVGMFHYVRKPRDL